MHDRTFLHSYFGKKQMTILSLRLLSICVCVLLGPSRLSLEFLISSNTIE